MNEYFAADPAVCSSVSDLRFLLERFGPDAGRYLACYPTNWKELVEQRFPDERPIERARATTLLRRASENLKLVASSGWSFDPAQEWIANVLPLIAPPHKKLTGAVCNGCDVADVFSLDDFDLPPTADERIAATPSEFARVTKIVCRSSAELFLIDAYANPCKKAVFEVLAELLASIGKGKCGRLVIFSRIDEIIGPRLYSEGEVRGKLAELRTKARLPSTFRLEMLLLEDSRAEERLHARYLFSIRGGVKSDQGFQSLPKPRKVEVGPIGRNVLKELLSVFVENLDEITLGQGYKGLTRGLHIVAQGS